MTDIVIGSGPAGYAAIKARLALGQKVIVIDVGHDLEPALEETRAALARAEPDDWSTDLVSKFKTSQDTAKGGIARFGSDHAVRQMSDVIETNSNEVMLRSSHAMGGLSNVWGSAVLPWSGDDLQDWPIQADELQPHVKAVSDFMPIAGSGEGLCPEFELEGLSHVSPLPATRQSTDLIQRLARISSHDTWAGAAMQAVAPGCKSCGLCLYGCPYRLIFSTAPEIAALRDNNTIGYMRGEAVAINETDSGVEVRIKDQPEPVTADRVFVAAGVLETTRLLFASNPDLATKGVTLRESRHFFTPFLHPGRAGHPGRDPHHTLAQAFVTLKDPSISPNLIHTQIYGWNDFYAREMVANYGMGVAVSKRAFDWLARRLFAAQTFLHSDHCHQIALHPAGDGAHRLRADLIKAPEFDAHVGNARRLLAKRLRPAGLYAVGTGSRLDPPGASFHTGGTLPMAKDPTGSETDTLGRPFGANHIHIVDASVLPAIPATTITFPVMANAHRIATRA